MTLKEIAEEANVSIATVSRVINSRNAHAASIELQQKIWDIAKRGGYIPTPASTAKPTEKENAKRPIRVIACIFARETRMASDNEYFAGIARCFEYASLARNYTTESYYSALETSRGNIDAVLNRHLDGVVVIGRHSRELIDKVYAKVNNVIYAGLARPTGDDYDSVICDRYSIGYTAGKHLLELGHKKITYIGEMDKEITFDGFKAALREYGVPVTAGMTEECAASMENGFRAMTALINRKERPTAVFCMNDYLAIGAMRALHEKGLRCPQDISIIGVDDIEAAAFTTPGLTTIHTPMKELGEVAAKLLIDRIEGGHTITLKVNLPFHIVERESCAHA